MDQVAISPPSRMASSSNQFIKLAATLLLGVAMGALLTLVVLGQVPQATAAPIVRQAVTDGWAQSPITRAGGLAAFSAAERFALTDGWAQSPITRAGGLNSNSYDSRATTDGWIQSPITRAGGIEAYSGS
jgi:hypothetical protein